MFSWFVFRYCNAFILGRCILWKLPFLLFIETWCDFVIVIMMHSWPFLPLLSVTLFQSHCHGSFSSESSFEDVLHAAERELLLKLVASSMRLCDTLGYV